jgi:hypothetical protein
MAPVCVQWQPARQMCVGACAVANVRVWRRLSTRVASLQHLQQHLPCQQRDIVALLVKSCSRHTSSQPASASCEHVKSGTSPVYIHSYIVMCDPACCKK